MEFPGISLDVASSFLLARLLQIIHPIPPRINMLPIVAPTATPAIPPRDSPGFELDSDIAFVSSLEVTSVVLAVVSVVRVVDAMDAVIVFVSSGALTFTY